MVNPTTSAIQHRRRFTLSQKRSLLKEVENLRGRGVALEPACLVLKIHVKQFYDWTAKIKKEEEDGVVIAQSKKSINGREQELCL